MKRFLISIPLVIVIVMFVTILSNSFEKTYSNYKKNVNININDTTGNLVCDATLDNPGTYVSDDGWAYFRIIIKNYNSEKISEVPVEYNVNITSTNNANAYYRYSIDDYTSEFASSILTNNYQLAADSQQTKEIIVEVKTDSKASDNVGFNVDVNCYQTTK